MRQDKVEAGGESKLFIQTIDLLFEGEGEKGRTHEAQ
jgi:ribosome-associated protein YbcJ (S4-like RNA binding protein)